MRLALIAIFTSMIITTYYIPTLVEAQKITREICDSEICNVKITDEGFLPKILTLKVGTTVVWTNADDERHTVTSGSPGEITAPLKSLLLENGDTYEFTFIHSGLYEGSYKYFDQVTKIMRGEIMVESEEVKREEMPESNTIKIDFNEPDSGVRMVSLQSGIIKSMEIDPDFNSLIINLEDVEIIGKLEISLDRNLIDSRANGNDDHFVVLVDGEEGFYDETSSTPDERTLEIVVQRKTTSIEIIGTQVIPEFSVVLLVVAAIFTTMIAAFRLRPRLGQLQ